MSLSVKIISKSVYFVIASLIVLSGCATGSVMSDKMSAHRAVDYSIASGGFSNAVEAIVTAQQSDRPIYDTKNAISLYMDKGMLEYYAGDYRSSAQSLQDAERFITEAFTKSVSDNVASYILNDNTKEYPGEDFEDIYLSVFNSLNYFRQDNLDGALVEVRKLTLPNGKLDMLERKYEAANAKARAENEREIQQASAGGSMPEIKHVTFSNSALARYLSVLFYQADKNDDASRIELGQLREAFQSQPTIYKHPLPTAINAIDNIQTEGVRLDILAFVGLSPIKEEKVFTQNFPFFQEKSLQNPLFKLPVLVERPNKITGVEIVVGDQSQTLELLEDLGAVIKDSFNARYSGIFLKTYIRTLLKYTALDLLDKETQKKAGGGFGSLLQAGGMMVAKAAFDATEHADVRMSRFLPDKAYMGSITLQPATYDVTINYFQGNELLYSEIKENYEISAENINLLQLVNLGIDKDYLDQMNIGDMVAGKGGRAGRGRSGGRSRLGGDNTESERVMFPKIFVGGGLSWFSGYNADIESVFGYNIGTSIEKRSLKTPFISEVGFRFITKGAEIQTIQYIEEYHGPLGFKVRDKITMESFDIFAKVKYNIPFSSEMSIQPFAGYALGMVHHAEERVKALGYTETFGVKGVLNDTHHIILLGSDISLTDTVFVGVEYDIGLSRLIKDKYTATAGGRSNNSLKAHSVMINTGLKF